MDNVYRWLKAMPLRRGPRRLIGGVCGGIAKKTGWDVGMVRLITLIMIILPILSVPAYVIAWLVVPWGASDVAAEEASRRSPEYQTIPPREQDPLLLEKFLDWGAQKLRQ